MTGMMTNGAAKLAGKLDAQAGQKTVLVTERPCVYQDEFDLRKILAVLKAHLLPLVVTMLIVLAFGAYLAATIKPAYRSTAILNVEDRTSLINEDLMLTNEIKVLTRDATILSTVPLAVRVLQSLAVEEARRSGGKNQPTPVTGDQIRHFIKNLTVEQAAGASVIKISYRDSDPERAARVVNRVVDEFRAFKSELLSRRFDAEKRAVNKEIERLKKEVTAAENAVATYKRAHNLSDDIGISMKVRQIGELNTQLTLARAELAEAENRWSRVSALQRAGDAEALGAVTDSSLVRSLREKQSALLARIAHLKQEYGNSHPILVEARAELKSLQISIQKELNYIADSFKGQVTARKRKVSLLRNDIARLEAEVFKGQAAMVKLKDLQRDVESSRRVLEKYLVAGKQQGISVAGRTALEDPMTVISRGFIPSDAVFPKPGQIMLLAVMAAGILGLMVAFVAEHLYPKVGSRTFRSIRFEDIPAETINQQHVTDPDERTPVVERRKASAQPDTPGLRNLVVPIPGDGLSIVPATEAVTKKNSRFSQAILRLNNVLLAKSDKEGNGIVVVTSVNRRGDKVSVATGLAALSAEQGKKVILVDLSLGESEPQHALGLDAAPGMSEVMHNHLPLLKAIQTDIRTHVSFFARGEGLQQAEKAQLLLAAPALFKLLQRYFDVIVVVVEDIRPIVEESAFSKITDFADRVLVVVEENGTHHARLISLLFKSVLAGIREKAIPVFVRRDPG